MTQSPHWRITIEDAILEHQNGCLTAKGLLKTYFMVKLQIGWSIKVNPKKIQKELGLSSSTFWRVLNALKEDGLINFDEPEELMITRLDSCPKNGTSSQKWDSHPKNGTAIPKMG